MARKLLQATNASLSVDASPVTSNPWAMGCWYRKLTTSVTTQTLMFYGDKDTNVVDLAMRINENSGYLEVWDSTYSLLVRDTVNSADDAWHHGAVVCWEEYYAPGTERYYVELWRDGSLIGSANALINSGEETATYADRFALGRTLNSAPGLPLGGSLAGAWMAGGERLGVDLIGAMSRGASPPRVLGSLLKGYWPVCGIDSPEPEVTGKSLALT
ncbi:MAG: hypothetical protein AABZ12_03645, partial [Planctomycetota bacterium]